MTAFTRISENNWQSAGCGSCGAKKPGALLVSDGARTFYNANQSETFIQTPGRVIRFPALSVALNVNPDDVSYFSATPGVTRLDQPFAPHNRLTGYVL